MSAHWCCTAWNMPIGLPNCFRVLAYSTVISRVRCMPPTSSAASAAVAMSRALGRSVPEPIFSAGVLLNSTTYSLRVRSIADIGDIFRPRALESTTNTPLRATTTMKSAMAASVTKNFLPVSFPLVALSCTSRGFQLAPASTRATVARTSPRQMGARYLFWWAGEPTASNTEPARTTVEKNGPGNRARPASSIKSMSSSLPRPTPPYPSGKMMPVYPCSVIFDQSAASYAVSVSISRRISALGHSPAKNLRALSLRNSWLSLSPNSIGHRLVALGQAQHKMSDDTALHFRCACFDGVPARPKIAVRPDALIDRTTVPAEQLAVRTKHFLRDLLESLVQLAPEDFLNGPFRPRGARSGDPAESAQLVQAHDFNLGVALCELLPCKRVLGGRVSVLLKLSREFNQPADVALEKWMETRSKRATLVHERADSHIPAVIHLPEYVFHRHAHVMEEHLVEFTFPRHLA